MIGAFANGVAVTFLPLFLLPALGDMGLSNATFSDAVYGVVGLALSGLSSASGQVAIIVGILASVVALFVTSLALRRRDSRSSAEHPSESASV